MNKYSVSDLSKIIGVPRTTINDWLNRYSQYIDFKVQGKRKIYLDSTVDVLQEISQLRESGMSSFDIEEELEKRHPLHGEVAEPEEIVQPSPAETQRMMMDPSGNPLHQEEPQAQAPTPEDTGSELVVKDYSQEFAVIAKQQSDELAQLITDHLRNMTQRIDDLEHQNKTISSKAKSRYAMSMAAVACIIIIAAVVAAFMFSTLDSKNSELSENLKNQANNITDLKDKYLTENNKLKRKKDELESKIAKSKSQLELTKNQLDQTLGKTEELKNELATQEMDFKKVLKQEQSERKKKEAEILKIRDQYADKILKKMQALETAVQQGAKKEQKIEELRKQIQERHHELQRLREEKEALKQKAEKLLDPSAPETTDNKTDKSQKNRKDLAADKAKRESSAKKLEEAKKKRLSAL